MFTIVPRRVTRGSGATDCDAEIFVGAFTFRSMPDPALLHVEGSDKLIRVAPWQVIDGGRAEPIYWWEHTLRGLESNRQYELSLLHNSQRIARATVETLPQSLPRGESGVGRTRPFTIWLSSCYSARQSPHGLGEVVRRLADNPRLRPHIKCLVGDQVYLDELSLFIYSALGQSRLRSRFNQQYARAWTHPDFSQLLATNGAFFLPDDHELWNNYPDEPFGLPFRGADFWRDWFRLAYEERCMPLQAPRPIEQLDVGDDLSVFIADVRTCRATGAGLFMTEGGYGNTPAGAGNIEKLVEWLKNLNCPGVLVVQQPVIAFRGDSANRTLPDYEQYWRRLLPALYDCRQDIVILTGDSHHGQVGTTLLSGKRKPAHQLIQIVSSPLALVSPIAASTGQSLPDYFPAPPPQPGEREGEPSPVTYPMRVPCYRSYGVPRTEEHGMTVSFWREDAEQIGMRVQTWLVRAASQNVGPTWTTTLRVRAPP